ncbi:hypothetical protein NEDG_02071 [Nematocida displodere]|uniref:Uncharacterized protein n=1 Tax=Nematocida displodere TaxID=1805483 RepID=A0A177ELS0_9MICR|nr:hypothetical protein NEDG_02071 [Nematocida displodere]
MWKIASFLLDTFVAPILLLNAVYLDEFSQGWFLFSHLISPHRLCWPCVLARIFYIETEGHQKVDCPLYSLDPWIKEGHIDYWVLVGLCRFVYYYWINVTCLTVLVRGLLWVCSLVPTLLFPPSFLYGITTPFVICLFTPYLLWALSQSLVSLQERITGLMYGRLFRCEACPTLCLATMPIELGYFLVSVIVYGKPVFARFEQIKDVSLWNIILAPMKNPLPAFVLFFLALRLGLWLYHTYSFRKQHWAEFKDRLCLLVMLAMAIGVVIGGIFLIVSLAAHVIGFCSILVG